MKVATCSVSDNWSLTSVCTQVTTLLQLVTDTKTPQPLQWMCSTVQQYTTNIDLVLLVHKNAQYLLFYIVAARLFQCTWLKKVIGGFATTAAIGEFATPLKGVLSRFSFESLFGRIGHHERNEIETFVSGMGRYFKCSQQL